MLKADRQLIMLDDHDSETLPFHYDKFVYLFCDVLSFYKTVIQAELQSNYSFPSLFSPCSALETCQWVQNFFQQIFSCDSDLRNSSVSPLVRLLVTIMSK